MDNKEIVKNYLSRVWEQGDIQAVRDFFTSETLIHSPFKKAKGTAAMEEVVNRWFEIFPDLTCYWDDLISEKNKVMIRWHAIGTHMGTFFETAPTHKEVCYGGAHIYTLENGKIIDFWSLVDLYGIFAQIN